MSFPRTPSYSLGFKTNTIGAGASAASPIVSIRWSDTTRAFVLRSLRLSAGCVTGFAAGFVTFDVIKASAFSAADSSGNAVAWTATDSNRRRSVFADSAFATAGEVRVSDTGALSAGTRTLDTNPLIALTTSAATTAGAPILPPMTELVPQYPGAYPIVLTAAAAATSQGLIVRATVPATGTWSASFTMDWEEWTEY